MIFPSCAHKTKQSSQPTSQTYLFEVEGTWAAWGSWNTCSTSCGTGTQSRTRSYSGGVPCTGSSADTQNCQGKQYEHYSMKQSSSNIHTHFDQSKEYGQHGELGALALQHAIAMEW